MSCDFKILVLEIWEFCMFDSKNNRMLDSVAFRLALITAVFVAWYGAGYLLLSV